MILIQIYKVKIKEKFDTDQLIIQSFIISDIYPDVKVNVNHKFKKIIKEGILQQKKMFLLENTFSIQLLQPKSVQGVH